MLPCIVFVFKSAHSSDVRMIIIVWKFQASSDNTSYRDLMALDSSSSIDVLVSNPLFINPTVTEEGVFQHC